LDHQNAKKHCKINEKLDISTPGGTQNSIVFLNICCKTNGKSIKTLRKIIKKIKTN